MPHKSIRNFPPVFLLCMPFFWLSVMTAAFLIYGPSGHDDAHINFWFAHTLLDRGDLVNYNGDRINQATNLLLVACMALSKILLPFDLVTIGYLIDILACFACCGIGTWITRKVYPSAASWPALLMFSSLSFLVWTFGGMGIVLAGLCLLVAAVIWWRFIDAPELTLSHYAALAITTLSLAFVRPEMSIAIPVINIYMLAFFFRDPVKRKRCLNILLFSATGSLFFFGFQKFYFSSWLPVPVIAKQSIDLIPRITSGSLYVIAYSIINPIIGIALLLSLPISLRNLSNKSDTNISNKNSNHQSTKISKTLWVALTATFQVYVGFAWAAGGDWMQAGRLLAPSIPIAATLVTLFAFSVLRRSLIAHILLASLAASGLAFHPGFLRDSATGMPAWLRYRMQPEHVSHSWFEQYNYEHLRDMATIDHLSHIIPSLYKQIGRPVQLTSGQAGMVFYYLAKENPGMIHFTDIRGLIEDSLRLCIELKELRHDIYGLAWNGYSEYFSKLPLLQDKCNAQKPDIVFDLDGIYKEPINTFTDAGYTLIHEEGGLLIENDRNLPSGFSAPLLNYIYIRSDLLPLLGNSNKRVINYESIPLHRRWGYELFRSDFFALNPLQTER